ncbi:hypothetical protein Pst134EA_028977 [Puccinia striiformis f. sp. tritici]|uniref:hypothetical protein n=1 Tax=Puccinia striiformis f. sp. tritici TaxID=168172 RepID=UPI0020074896|nr:hypothetical protein Pst134EA_028977 [Puccinia striiformis f. sp. tritici]KAH9446993.1 hypothetical protein Pst134EA_028977 [Puccinia striiformis f. sp. tritici]
MSLYICRFVILLGLNIACNALEESSGRSFSPFLDWKSESSHLDEILGIGAVTPAETTGRPSIPHYAPPTMNSRVFYPSAPPANLAMGTSTMFQPHHEQLLTNVHVAPTLSEYGNAPGHYRNSASADFTPFQWPASQYGESSQSVPTGSSQDPFHYNLGWNTFTNGFSSQEYTNELPSIHAPGNRRLMTMKDLNSHTHQSENMDQPLASDETTTWQLSTARDEDHVPSTRNAIWTRPIPKKFRARPPDPQVMVENRLGEISLPAISNTIRPVDQQPKRSSDDMTRYSDAGRMIQTQHKNMKIQREHSMRNIFKFDYGVFGRHNPSVKEKERINALNALTEPLPNRQLQISDDKPQEFYEKFCQLFHIRGTLGKNKKTIKQKLKEDATRVHNRRALFNSAVDQIMYMKDYWYRFWEEKYKIQFHSIGFVREKYCSGTVVERDFVLFIFYVDMIGTIIRHGEEIKPDGRQGTRSIPMELAIKFYEATGKIKWSYQDDPLLFERYALVQSEQGSGAQKLTQKSVSDRLWMSIESLVGLPGYENLYTMFFLTGPGGGHQLATKGFFNDVFCHSITTLNQRLFNYYNSRI